MPKHPIKTEYHGDSFLEPKEVPVGAQSVRAAEQDAHLAQERLAEARRLNEDKLAEDIIEEGRTRLMLKFRFLDKALWRMGMSSVRSGLAYPIGTNGSSLFYDPARVIARFRESIDEVIRDYLHLILHCIFKHPFDKAHNDKDAWNMTCDIIAESVAMDLCGTRFPSDDDDARQQALDEIALDAGGLLPNKVYDFLRELSRTPSGQQYHGLTQSTLSEWRRLFERDDPAMWPANTKGKNTDEHAEDEHPDEAFEDEDDPDSQSDGIDTQTLENDESGEDERRSPSSENDGDGNSESGREELDETADDSSDASDSQPDAHFDLDELTRNAQEDKGLEKDWEEISKEIELNLETFSKEWGKESKNLVTNLMIATRKTYDYTDFLRQFMTVSEQIKLNLEEFDYTYYMFGMDMYGNMPFIEPLEYKETASVRDFVIAIDTSESVSGNLVRKFVNHTFSILKESENQSTDVNIHVIQADSKVQSDLKITDLRDVDKLLSGFSVRGFGGTDFRPVFDYVQMLRNRGELADLKGLVYFTDGMGSFPEKMPDYDTAFVFVDDGSREVAPVPPWAMKLVIDERDVEGFE